MRTYKRTNCLLCEHCPSEPDEGYALYCLVVQERVLVSPAQGILGKPYVGNIPFPIEIDNGISWDIFIRDK